MTSDKILERFRQMQWRYAPQDPAARETLSNRIAEAGRKGGTITYSALVMGVTFHLPSLTEPHHMVDTTEWQDIDRAIVGDFLGYLSMESYERSGFLCSALVVSKADGTPGEGSTRCSRSSAWSRIPGQTRRCTCGPITLPRRTSTMARHDDEPVYWVVELRYNQPKLCVRLKSKGRLSCHTW